MTKKEVELIIDTIDALGVALADEGHTWSPELRRMYENAIRLLTRIQELAEEENWTLPGAPDGPFPVDERFPKGARIPKTKVETGPDIGTKVTVDFRAAETHWGTYDW